MKVVSGRVTDKMIVAAWSLHQEHASKVPWDVTVILPPWVRVVSQDFAVPLAHPCLGFWRKRSLLEAKRDEMTHCPSAHPP